MSWLEIAKNLPTGQKARADCPECGEGTNTNAAIVNHSIKGYSLYCNACGYNPFEGKGKLSLAELAHIQKLNDEALKPITKLELPDDYSTDIPLQGRLWLYKAGINPVQWREHKIGYSEKLGRVVLPVFDDKDNLIWFQCRAIHKGQKPKYIQPSRDKDGILFHVKTSGTISSTVVIAEDILSAIRLSEYTNTASILGTKLNAGQAQVLSTYSKCITWLDSDKAGRKGARDIRRTMGLVCEVGNIVTREDPKCLSRKEIRIELEKANAYSTT
jgi:hypothetical protein